MKTELADKVVSYINNAELLSIAERLIQIPSPTEQEKEVVLLVQTLLKNEGFDTLIQEVSPSRPQLIATLKGKGGGRSLMLNGHLDNDSITASWK